MSNKTETNPLLEDINNYPSITVTLPTRGLFYDEGMFEPDTSTDEIEVHPFSMWEEVHFSNPFTIMSGKATRKLVETVAPTILNPDGLCSYDVDMLVLAGRLASYGKELEVELVCGNPDEDAIETEVEVNGEKKKKKSRCQHKSKMKLDVQNVMNTYPIINDEDLVNWQVELPSGQTVLLQPALHKDVLETMKVGVNQHKIMEALKRFEDMDEAKRMELNDATIENYKTVKVALLVSGIRAVQLADKSRTIKDRKMIVEWLSKMNPSWVDMIHDKLEELAAPYGTPGEVSYVCDQCGFENKNINVVQDPSRFFTRG